MGRTQLLVVVMVLCTAKCFGMTYDELEDFADYLKRTSQLSPILKKGVEADEPDDEVVSDNAWEESDKFEGDLILNERQRRMIVESVAEGLSRNGIRDSTKRWPNNEVIYFIQVEHFRHDQVQAIQDAIDDLQRASCVRFRRYRKGDPDAVVIQGSRRGCFSQVGYQGGYQVLNLSGRHPTGRGCFRHGTIVHELLHTLGFYHMQSSPVRDDYVDIVWDNIVQAARHNFRKYNSFSVSNFGVSYDYDSVLHYSKHAFSVNGKDTIVPKQSGVVIGQRIGLSEKDTLKLNKMYCDADSDDDEEEENNKNKKKIVKKKPKLIQGLGYHQGKAVVFKVPTAIPHKLLQNDRIPYTFHDFSKTPQVLPSSENEENSAGKEITYSYEYKPREQFFDTYEEPAYYNRDEAKIHHGNQLNPLYQQQNNNKVAGAKDMVHVNVNTAMGNPYDKEQTLHHADEGAQEPSLIEAFDRLSKIIKFHVYPSQTPDLSVYKMNEKETNHENNKEVVKNEHVNVVIISPMKSQNMAQVEKENSAMNLINKVYDSNKYQSYKRLKDHYSPIYNYYEHDTKPQDVLPLKERHIDPSYITSFSEEYEGYKQLEDPLSSKMQYGDQDGYTKYSPKTLDGTRSQGDECKKYTPIGFKYYNEAGQDSSSSSRLSPLRYLIVPGTHPLEDYNVVRDQEYYR